jgi:hypothetical protein
MLIRTTAICLAFSLTFLPTAAEIDVETAVDETENTEELLEDVEEDNEEYTDSDALPPVQSMGSSLFNSKVIGSEHKEDWIIHLKTSWCERCEESAVAMKEAQEYYEHINPRNMNFAEVDCGWHSSICSQFGPKTYPKLVMVTGSPREIYLYEGEREASAELLEFAEQRGKGQQLLPFVIELESVGVLPDVAAVLEDVVLYMERYLDELTMFQDPLLNAVTLGVALGAALVFPLVLINLIFVALEMFMTPTKSQKVKAVAAATSTAVTEKLAATKNAEKLSGANVTPPTEGPDSRACEDAAVVKKKLFLSKQD